MNKKIIKPFFYKELFFCYSSAVMFLFCSTLYGKQSNEMVDLQFFGDFYLPHHVAKQTKTTPTDPRVFKHLHEMLNTSYHNIINFEGVATTAFVSPTFKRYSLKMPTWTGEALNQVGIHYANLANNHTMDFGLQGLFDSMATLNEQAITTFGAGQNIDEAAKPILVQTKSGVVCLVAFSRTLPTSFWATKTKPGTSFLEYNQTKKAIKSCTDQGYFTVVNFHWGQESIKVPKTYQRDLARLSINSGADLVIGHHPHILQSIEIYKGKPIFYSIGNFVFGSYTKTKPQEGIAVRVSLGKKTIYDLVPINVQNSEVKFIPRLFEINEKNPLESYIPRDQCRVFKGHYLKKMVYRCHFGS